MMKFNLELKQLIQDRLEREDWMDFSHLSLKPAAVALVVTCKPGSDEPCLLLTRRAVHLKRHAGQYAFPGGKLDPGETIEAAALRECEEEIGLELQETSVLGRLDDFATRSGFCISSRVVWCPHPEMLNPDSREVEKVFSIPFEELSDPEINERMLKLEDQQTIGFSLLLPSIGHQVFAPTAAILYQFREVVLFERMTRVHDLEQPRFTWK